jgi:hypothetical protein
MVAKIRTSVPGDILCGVLAFAGLVGLAAWAAADPGPVTQSGLPVQVQPSAPEPGLPQFSFPSGNPDTSGGSGGSGSADGSGSGGGTGGGSGGGSLPPNATLEQVAQQNYIQTAASAAGISPEALAATCMVESNCQNVGASSGSSASGEFQMINSTYLSMINQFAQENPDIPVDTSLAGKMDPQNEAYAAAQYLADGVQALQAAGDANPTNVDLRGYYQFGAGLGSQIALAQPDQNLEDIVQLTPAQMAANGITSTTTVGQWRQTYANKVGAAAYQAVGV